MNENERIFKEFFKIAIEQTGERAAYANADILRDKAIEQLLVMKGILKEEEIDTQTAKNMKEVIDHLKNRGIKSPF